MKALLVAAVVMALGGVARADSVDDLIEQVTTSTDDTVRLSAVATLAKEGGRRAIPALAEALAGDDSETVRAAAAIGLGKVVTEATSTDDRNRARSALERAKKDPDPKVRKIARKMLAKLEKLDDVVGVYVELGAMTSNLGATSPSDADLMAAMQKRVEAVVQRDATDWQTTLPAGVDATKVHGYHLDGEVDEVVTTGTKVRCKVRLRISTYPDLKVFANVSGGAAVVVDGAADVEGATYDCVGAVIEDLMVKKVIPAIEAGRVSTSATASSAPAVSEASTDATTWSPDGWTLLGEDDVDLVDDVVEVDRRKSTWSEVAIVVTGDEVQVDAVELALAGKGRKRHHAELAQTFGGDSRPRIIELAGKRRTIDQVRLTYTKHRLDAQTRVQVWAR